MFTPYDWQEGIGNRAQYVEGRLANGAPVLAVSIDPGILVFTYRRQSRKIFEIYDRLVFSAIGQQSDIEAMRAAALEFATREGYNRSEEDVTISRVATAMSAPLKRAFADFGASPIVARSIFAEVGAAPEADLYYLVDYDGDYATSRRRAVAAGTLDVGAELERLLDGFSEANPEEAIERLKEIWRQGIDPDRIRADEEVYEGLSPEAVLVERGSAREDRFRVLLREEI